MSVLAVRATYVPAFARVDGGNVIARVSVGALDDPSAKTEAEKSASAMGINIFFGILIVGSLILFLISKPIA